MSYIEPSVTIQQEFATIPSVIVEPLQTCIVGPNYRVFEYSDATDKTSILAGNYTGSALTAIPYGGKPAGSVVDTKSVKLVLEDLWAKYATFTSASTRDALTNKIALSSGSFVASTGYPRNGSLGTRDVKVGDGVRITYSDNTTLDTTVTGFANTPVASTGPATATNASSNLGSSPVSASVATPITLAGGSTATASVSSYTGNLAGGFMSDFYTLTCTAAGAGGTKQVNTATVGAAASTGGTATVTVTSDGQDIIVPVPLVNADATNAIATKIRAALLATYAINSKYDVSGSTSAVILTSKKVLANDTTLNIKIAPTGSGITSVPTSTNGTPGVASGAKFSVTSTNGDNISDFGVTAIGSAFYVGSFGLTVTVTGTYVLGDKYTISPIAAYTRVVPDIAGSGAFLGSVDTTYTIKVVSGGLWFGGNDTIRISASTNTGIDYVPSTIIPSPTVLDASVSFTLGSLGLSMTFATNVAPKGLVTGESYTVAITAATAGPINKIVLADNPSTTLGSAANVPLLQLSIVKSYLEIPIAGYPTGGSVALTASANNYTIAGSLSILDSSWGETPIPVLKAKAYVPYRALLVNGSLEFNTISDISEIDTVLGKTIPANPLAYGVYKALENSNGQVVNYISIATDDITGYTNSIETLSKHEECYFVVPLTSDNATQQLFKSHVDTMSSKTKGLERVLFISKTGSDTEVLYGKKSDGSYWMGTIATNTTVNIPGATFQTSGVRAGDSVRTVFSVDGFGNPTYTTSTVASVVSQTQLLLASPGAVTNSDLNRIDIIRNLSRDEQASAIANQSGSLDNRRDYVIWPDLPIDDNGLEVPGHFLACSVAGLKSSVAPHQGITNYTLTGWSNMARSYKYFTPAQLNVIAGGGTMIVTQNATGGAIYIRHQLSSDQVDANRAELSITTNLDAITKFLRGDLKKFIGKYNNTASFHQVAHAMITQKISYLMSNTQTVTAGPQVTSFDTNSLIVESDPLIRTTVNASLSIGLPYPVNNFNLVLTVI